MHKAGEEIKGALTKALIKIPKTSCLFLRPFIEDSPSQRVDEVPIDIRVRLHSQTSILMNILLALICIILFNFKLSLASECKPIIYSLIDKLVPMQLLK